MTEEHAFPPPAPFPSAPPAPFPSAPPAPPAPRTPPAPPATLSDVVFALALLVLGFCFADWGILRNGGTGVGATVFFLVALVASLLYLRVRGVRQNAKSLFMLLIAVAGSLPFTLYDNWGVGTILLLFEGCVCLLWVMYSCRTGLAATLTWLKSADLVNQLFIVPFANFPALFTRPLQFIRNRSGSSLHLSRPLLLALVGILVSLPVLGLVIFLLAASDDGFQSLLDNFRHFLSFDDIPRYIMEFVFGIPIAAYVFGAVAGNASHRHTAHLSAEGMRHSFTAAHALPKAALYAPLALFAVIYLIYFIAMGSYLFSGMRGELPVVYTYAEYARRGFFELCGVATINLIILAGIWLFAKRGEREYPPALRVLAGLLALLTCLLIVTAISKMMLYVDTYGLTQLRVYTLWFMVFILVAFLILVAWHVHHFNAARPIIILAMVFTLALGLANTNGNIANYNVDRYLAGHAERIDVNHLSRLGDGAIPALSRLGSDAEDPAVREKAKGALAQKRELRYDSMLHSLQRETTWTDWPQWTYQSQQARLYLD